MLVFMPLNMVLPIKKYMNRHYFTLISSVFTLK